MLCSPYLEMTYKLPHGGAWTKAELLGICLGYQVNLHGLLCRLTAWKGTKTANSCVLKRFLDYGSKSKGSYLPSNYHDSNFLYVYLAVGCVNILEGGNHGILYK